MTHFPTPTTIEEAADHVLAQMNEANQAELRAMARDELWRCDFGLAMGIRSSLKLWEPGNPIVANSGIFHPDDCSMAIVTRIWEKLQGGARFWFSHDRPLSTPPSPKMTWAYFFVPKVVQIDCFGPRLTMQSLQLPTEILPSILPPCSPYTA